MLNMVIITQIINLYLNNLPPVIPLNPPSRFAKGEADSAIK